MERLVVTDFDEKSWAEHGLNWMRAAKSARLDGWVIDRGLSGEALAKLNDVDFLVTPLIQKTGVLDFDLIYTLAFQMPDDKHCLLVQNTFDFHSDVNRFFTDQSGLACTVVEADLRTMISPVASLERRVAFAKDIEDRILSIHGGLLSDAVLCGDCHAWRVFAGFYGFLLESGTLEHWPRLTQTVLNIFGGSTSFGVQILENHFLAESRT
jgi:hypothetical protein